MSKAIMAASTDLRQTKADITNGISQEQLKQPVTDDHILDISLEMTNWEDWASALKLTETQIEDVDAKRTKRLAVLRVWRETFGSTATYEKLIDALLKIKKRTKAEFVCSLLKPPSSPPVMNPAANHAPAQALPMASSQLPQVPISQPRARLEVDYSGTPSLGTPSPDTPTEFSQFGGGPQPSAHPPSSDKLSSDFQAKGLDLGNTLCFARQHWKLSELTGRGTTIAIIDTGISIHHSAFGIQGKILAYRNFYSDQQDDINDSHGHGTHCAGIAAGIAYGNAYLAGNPAHAITFNGGVAPDAQLIICRVAQTKDDFNLGAVDSALDWLMSLKQNGIKIDVLSMSFGSDCLNPIMEQKIGDLIKMGTTKTICVAAAGNDGRKEDIKYPAQINGVLCIGAHDSYENRAPFSPVGREMDFLAPGVNICSPSVDGYNALMLAEGTSCAAPAVAGLICLLIQCANLAGSPANEVIHDTQVIYALLKEMSTSRGTKHKDKCGYGALKPHWFFDKVDVRACGWAELHRVIQSVRPDVYQRQ